LRNRLVQHGLHRYFTYQKKVKDGCYVVKTLIIRIAVQPGGPYVHHTHQHTYDVAVIFRAFMEAGENFALYIMRTNTCKLSRAKYYQVVPIHIAHSTWQLLYIQTIAHSPCSSQ